jgi:K+-transporting ATPase ATPase C chain
MFGPILEHLLCKWDAPIPVDLITTSASGLDPDITPAAAEFQIPRVAHERRLPESTIRDLVRKYTQDRDWVYSAKRA